MIEWFGTIFSGISLYLQASEKGKLKERNRQFIEIVVTLFGKLKAAKDIHTCYQTVDTQSLRKYIDGYHKITDDQRSADWSNLYDLYQSNYTQNRIDVYLEKMDMPTSADDAIETLFNETPEARTLVKKLGLEHDVKTVMMSYPEMLKHINIFNETTKEYNETLLNSGEFRSSMHTTMRQGVMKLMWHADRIIKSLIDIQHSILLRLQE